jgi:hypothetical protein
MHSFISYFPSLSTRIGPKWPSSGVFTLLKLLYCPEYHLLTTHALWCFMLSMFQLPNYAVVHFSFVKFGDFAKTFCLTFLFLKLFLTMGLSMKLHNLYSSPSINRMIKSRRMRWAVHVARIMEKRDVHRTMVGKPQGKKPLGKPRRRWVDSSKMDLRDSMGWCGLVWYDSG